MLYHFTKKSRVPSILTQGINRGDVAISVRGKIEAPWLTEDPVYANQHWMTHSYRIQGITHVEGVEVSPLHCDKAEARLTVRIPTSARRKLHHWLTWAPRRVNRHWLAGLIEADGGEEWARFHWFYRGVVRPKWITAVDLMKPPSKEATGFGFGQTRVSRNKIVDMRLPNTFRVSPRAQEVTRELSIDKGFFAYCVHRAIQGDFGDADPAKNAQVIQAKTGLLQGIYRTPTCSFRVLIHLPSKQVAILLENEPWTE